jgi:dipeptidyl aminopeptidase/acylaminoacyl peptidase
MRKLLLLVTALLPLYLLAQQKTEKLTVEKIMSDPRWMGSSPSNTQWSENSQQLYFRWNPNGDAADSLYYISLTDKKPVKATPTQTQEWMNTGNYIYTADRNAYVYAKEGDVFFVDIKKKITLRITSTTDAEAGPRFSFNESKVVYSRNQNLYAWDIATGETLQLTNIKSNDATAAPRTAGNFPPRAGATNVQEDWLKNDQLQYLQVLKERKENRDKATAYNNTLPKPKELRSIAIDDKFLTGLTISPDGRFISYGLIRRATSGRNTIIPDYVTESGFTTDINGRTKVGAPQSSSEYFIYDRQKDTVYTFKTDAIPGIKDLPDYLADYPKQAEERKKKNANRTVSVQNISWSPRGQYAVVEVRADDNKDRWLLLWDTATNNIKQLDRQRDEAWVAGPGIGFGRNTGWVTETDFWFQSEASGYSHLYTVNVASGEKKALTSGNYEVQQVLLSADKKYFYIATNEVHPGERQFYRLTIATQKQERITTLTGSNMVSVSPDEKYLAILYSYTNKPWELYLQENKPGGKLQQITNKAQSETFASYPWRDAEVISFTARDGATVYARLYKPATPHANKPAVVFVHGAGYLQNAHKWWSSYFREYMFNNLLADNGYYVLDIDYRGSAGYGRNCRTGIYRHMGGKDLTDQVDGINWLVKNYGVTPGHVGIYGGSYGGFITLMGLFTQPDAFAAGAALRSVTDWANYNHGYTSNILNEPFTDSLAYRCSSPFYFAEGLKGHLLMCHGMVDVNVHFQDIVKLSQRLIELGKNNWELAVYPMEDHGFVEPSSWTDEYKRIFNLFETVLKK